MTTVGPRPDGPPRLAQVLPAVAAALGAPVPPAVPGTPGPPLTLPTAPRAIVVLIDGLGDVLLERRGGHAPFLRRLRAAEPSRRLTVGFPSTTASSLGSFGTGTDVGTHGLVGTDILDPARGVLFSELSWDAAVDPVAWQPVPTVFERLQASGVDVSTVSAGFMDGSGLTTAALRGGRFVAAADLAGRIDGALELTRRAARAGAPSLAYVYWGDLDKTGHVHGSASWQWGEELGSVDAELSRLVRTAPRGTLVVITADHGMVDVPHPDRIDVADEPVLQTGVRVVGGELRAVQVYCEPGAADGARARWRDRLGPDYAVLTRDEAIAAGWFGRVRRGVAERIGDLVVCALGGGAVVDSRTMRPTVLRLIGVHGAASVDEVAVPLLVAGP